jgi:hypothetical protein
VVGSDGLGDQVEQVEYSRVIGYHQYAQQLIQHQTTVFKKIKNKIKNGNKNPKFEQVLMLKKKIQMFTKSKPQISKSKPEKKNLNKNHSPKNPNQLAWKAECLELLILKRRRLGCYCESMSGSGGESERDLRE